MFQVGVEYDRKELATLLGGNSQSYLPTVSGRVVLGCFARKLNPEAPLRVHVGGGPGRLREAGAALKTPAFPVFLKEGSACEYQGKFKATEYLPVVTAAENGDGEAIVGVLLLERVSD